MTRWIHAAALCACAFSAVACRPVTTTLEVPIAFAKTPILLGPVRAVGGAPVPALPESVPVTTTLTTEHGQSSTVVDLEHFGRYESREHSFHMGADGQGGGAADALLAKGIHCTYSSFAIFGGFFLAQEGETVCRSELYAAPPGGSFPPVNSR